MCSLCVTAPMVTFVFFQDREEAQGEVAQRAKKIKLFFPALFQEPVQQESLTC